MVDIPKFDPQIAKDVVAKQGVRSGIYRMLPPVDQDPGIEVRRMSLFPGSSLPAVDEVIRLKGREVFLGCLEAVIRDITGIHKPLGRINYLDILYTVGAYSAKEDRTLSPEEKYQTSTGRRLVRTTGWLRENYPRLQRINLEDQNKGTDDLVLKLFDVYRERFDRMRNPVVKKSGSLGSGQGAVRHSRRPGIIT